MFYQLKAPKNKKKKRLGRGPGSGLGKTSGKGHKGQLARSGGKSARGFEGGQMPLHRRIPKRGFVNIFKKQYQIVHIYQLNKFDEGANITKDSLFEKKIIKDKKGLVKLLVKGDLNKKVVVNVDKASKNAIKMVEDKGGQVNILEQK